MAYTPENNPYIPGDPYSYDLKWVVTNIKELIANYTGQMDELKAYIRNYIDNLDLSPIVAEELQRMYDNGEFDALIASFITDNKVLLVDTDQSAIFNDTEKATGRRNIGASAYNRNLIDNAWFTVQQRDIYTGNFTVGAKIDRWRTSFATDSTGTWTISGGNMDIISNSGYSYLIQRFDDPSIFTGKILTVSLLLNDNSILTGTKVRTTGRDDFITTSDYGIFISAGGEFTIVVSPYKRLTFKAVKMEIGPVSTLHYDNAPNYAEELAKCQRYFIRLTANNTYGTFGLGVVNNAAGTAGWVVVPLPTTMRNVPTATFGGTMRTLGFSGGALVNGSISNIVSGTGTSINCARLDITGTSMGAIGSPFILGADTDPTAYIDLSAEL